MVLSWWPGDDIQTNSQCRKEYQDSCSGRSRIVLAFARSDLIHRSVNIACLGSIPRWYLGRCFAGKSYLVRKKRNVLEWLGVLTYCVKTL